MIFSRVSGNPVQPGVKSAVPPEVGQCPKRLYKCLLCYVLYFCVITYVPADKLRYPSLVLEHEKVEGS